MLRAWQFTNFIHVLYKLNTTFSLNDVRTYVCIGEDYVSNKLKHVSGRSRISEPPPGHYRTDNAVLNFVRKTMHYRPWMV